MSRVELAGGGGFARSRGRTWLRTWRYISLGDGTAIKFEIHYYRPLNAAKERSS